MRAGMRAVLGTLCTGEQTYVAMIRALYLAVLRCDVVLEYDNPAPRIRGHLLVVEIHVLVGMLLSRGYICREIISLS